MWLTNALQVSDWVPIVCFILGFILVIVEMFHPGFGAPGIVGGILLVLGVVLSAQTLLAAFVMILVILALLGGILTLALQSAAKGRLSKTLVLSDFQNKDKGYIGFEDLKFFIGKEGKAITVLRPSGIADINGVKIDVITEGEFIPKETMLKVVAVQGRRIVVKQL